MVAAAYHFFMDDPARFKRLFGPYRTPRYHYGDVVTCEIRGDVKIVGLTAARIPWPKCRTGKRSRAIILYGALAEAVRRESALAVEYWWGVGSDTVWRWRKALGVDRVTDGTSARLSRRAPETIQSEEANRQREPALKSPARAAKIATAKRGTPRPPGVVEALRKKNTGKKASRATRRKMSEAHKRRGTRPPLAGEPWTVEEDALLGTMKDRDVAARTGRSESAVSERRYVLGVGAFTKRAPQGKPITWTPAKDWLLGTMSDVDLTRRLRCSSMAVFYRRRKLGIPRYRSQGARIQLTAV